MINLMYLVLTALLALNVSAEVMNAFFSLDKGMKNSGLIVDKANEGTLKSIAKQADAYKNPNNEKYNANAIKAQEIAKEFESYIEQIRNDLFAKAGGPNPKVPGQPKDIRNKDLTTRMFVNEGLGDQIKAKIESTRKDLLALADNDAGVAASLPLDVEQIPEGTKTQSWSEFKFKQMPVAAIFPILGKMQSDAKNSASAVLGYCQVKVNGEDVKFDAFQPAVTAPKGYVIAGDTYEAEVFLSAYSTQANNLSISVDGNGLPINQGVAKYSVKTGSTGTKTYKVNISVKNPLTGESKSYSKDFQYEVGQRSCSVALDKMNVFYIGVDNPISVAAAGVSSNDLKVSASGVTLNSDGKSHYIVKASTPGEASITLSGGGLPPTTFKYRVKRIPDPVPSLGKLRGGAVGNGEFKAQSGIAAILENFDFEARCEVVGYTVTFLQKRQDPSPETPNNGLRFNSTVQAMVDKARPGDAYFFDNIKAKCPGDGVARNLGSLAFKIK